jgi:uncharacterized membrane protein
MKKHITRFFIPGLLIAAVILMTAFAPVPKSYTDTYSKVINISNVLKAAAFKILNTKCNVCHRKRNPFMIFNQKNMVRRAPRIYRAVFVDQRMPKGDEVRLTKEEYTILKKWLNTQKTINNGNIN